MNESRYETRQALVDHTAGHYVIESATGRILAGVGHNPHRAWTFPLNTPNGHNVIQEHAFDHPFHNGIFVGQGYVMRGNQETNFWCTGPDFRKTHNPVFLHIGQLRYPTAPDIEITDDGVTFTYKTTWCDENHDPMLEEVRRVHVWACDDATICDTYTTKTAAYGPVTFAANKYGSIGVRIQPQLLPPLGGQVVAGRDGELKRGTAGDVVGNFPCDFVAFEAQPHGREPMGVCMAILDNSASSDRSGPWLVRDYGMVMFNATLNDSIPLEQDQAWQCALRVVAYDQPISLKRSQSWLMP